MGRVFSDLDLTGDSPVRVRPEYGEWGPALVPGTAQKKRMRIWVVLAFLGSAAVLVTVGSYWYRLLMGL